MSQGKGGRYVYLHVFVETVVHNERMTHPNSMWLHRMSRSISIIPVKSVSSILEARKHTLHRLHNRKKRLANRIAQIKGTYNHRNMPPLTISIWC